FLRSDLLTHVPPTPPMLQHCGFYFPHPLAACQPRLLIQAPGGLAVCVQSPDLDRRELTQPNRMAIVGILLQTALQSQCHACQFLLEFCKPWVLDVESIPRRPAWYRHQQCEARGDVQGAAHTVQDLPDMWLG